MISSTGDAANSMRWSVNRWEPFLPAVARSLKREREHSVYGLDLRSTTRVMAILSNEGSSTRGFSLSRLAYKIKALVTPGNGSCTSLRIRNTEIAWSGKERLIPFRQRSPGGNTGTTVSRSGIPSTLGEGERESTTSERRTYKSNLPCYTGGLQGTNYGRCPHKAYGNIESLPFALPEDQ
jgi:hypothetical protein